jgi:hypothetical protein
MDSIDKLLEEICGSVQVETIARIEQSGFIITTTQLLNPNPDGTEYETVTIRNKTYNSIDAGALVTRYCDSYYTLEDAQEGHSNITRMMLRDNAYSYSCKH